MISADFAPNEEIDDSLIGLRLLFQPWRWRKGRGVTGAKGKFKHLFKIGKNTPFHLSFFFTGRSALNFLIKSQSFPKNTEAIIQTFTCEAPIVPFLANKIKVVYTDIETTTFSADLKTLSGKITENTRIIVLQHTFGLRPVQREKVLALSKKHHLLLIEDLAHGFDLKTFPKMYRQTVKKYQNIAFLLSFGRSKALSSVFGAAIITPRQEIADQLHQWQRKLSYPSTRTLFGLLGYKILTPIIKKTYSLKIGKLIHHFVKFINLYPREITKKEKKGRYDRFFDRRFANLQALFLLHQLKKIKKYQQQRRKIVNLYNKNLNPSIKVDNLPCDPLIRYPVLVADRDEVWNKFRRQSIYLGRWYDQPIGPSPLKMKKIGYRRGSCPQAEKVSRAILNLPTLITKTEALKIIKLLDQYGN